MILPADQRLHVGADVRLRIRARDVSLALRRPDGVSIRNILPGKIDQIAPEPDTPFAEVFVALEGARIRARITRAALEDLQLAEGMDVYALIKSVSFDRGLR